MSDVHCFKQQQSNQKTKHLWARGDKSAWLSGERNSSGTAALFPLLLVANTDAGDHSCLKAQSVQKNYDGTLRVLRQCAVCRYYGAQLASFLCFCLFKVSHQYLHSCWSSQGALPWFHGWGQTKFSAQFFVVFAITFVLFAAQNDFCINEKKNILSAHPPCEECWAIRCAWPRKTGKRG